VISGTVADAELHQLGGSDDVSTLNVSWPSSNVMVEKSGEHFVMPFGGSTKVLSVSCGAPKIRVWTVGLTSRATSRTYEDDVRAQVSRLWAEDWDCEEDAVYDGDEW
jgi:hypothetical protein